MKAFSVAAPEARSTFLARPHPTICTPREGWCSSKKVEDYYQDPKVLLHQEGHCFPMLQPDAKEVYEVLCQEIKRHGLEKS